MKMTKTKIGIIVGLIVMAILATGCTSQDKIENLNTKIKEMNETINDKEESIEILNDSINRKQKEINIMRETINKREEEIGMMNDTINSMNLTLENIKNERREMRKNLNKLQDNDRIDFRPEFEEVKEVVEETKIDENDYDYDTYTCMDFAYDLVYELRKEGIYSCTTGLYHTSGAHSNIAVKTEDEGIVYIEPQTDQYIHELEIGDNYCDDLGWNCEWNITRIKHCFNRNPQDHTKLKDLK